MPRGTGELRKVAGWCTVAGRGAAGGRRSPGLEEAGQGSAHSNSPCAPRPSPWHGEVLAGAGRDHSVPCSSWPGGCTAAHRGQGQGGMGPVEVVPCSSSGGGWLGPC